MNDRNLGVGVSRPKDAEEFMEFRLLEENGVIVKAEFACSENASLIRCGETLCRVLPEHAVTDLFLTDNNVIYYNIEPELGLNELYLASITLFAAKRAAADWCRKNNVPIPADADACSCLTNTD